MLRREEAAKLLLNESTPHGQRDCLREIGTLPNPLRTIGYGLFGRKENGAEWEVPRLSFSATERDAQATLKHNKTEAAYLEFAALDGEDRLRIFTAVAPALAPFLDQAWLLLQRSPYQAGHVRRAFRRRTGHGLSPARRTWLEAMISSVLLYRTKDVVWFAEWAAHLNHGYIDPQFGRLFAAAIDMGGTVGERVFEVLTLTARGEHPSGVMGRHVTTGLLCAARPEGWAFVERLLLAAQREEGLRQVILETVDEAHPEAFRRMLHVIVENNLIRFSAVVRAVDVWFGFALDVDHERVIRDALPVLLSYLEDDAARRSHVARYANGMAALEAETGVNSIGGRAASHLYLALWAAAFDDAEAAVQEAAPILQSPDATTRLVVASLLAQLCIAPAQAALTPLLADPDLRVALTAFSGVTTTSHTAIDELSLPNGAVPDLFERLEALLPRLTSDGQAPRRQKKDAEPTLRVGLLPQAHWPWEMPGADATMVAHALLTYRGARSPKCLIPHLSVMDSYDRIRVAQLLGDLGLRDVEARAVLLTMAGDRSSWVRDQALATIGRHRLEAEDAPEIEALLTRKSAETRRSVLTLLLTQPDTGVLASVDRLLAARAPLMKIGGLDLLAELVRASRQTDAAQARATAYRDARGNNVSADEVGRLSTLAPGPGRNRVPEGTQDASLRSPVSPTLVADRRDDAIRGESLALPGVASTAGTGPEMSMAAWTVANAFGLIDDPSTLTPSVRPQQRDVRIDTAAARACLIQIDSVIEAHREVPISITTYHGTEEMLLGNAGRWFPAPTGSTDPEGWRAEAQACLPLIDLWCAWSSDRGAAERDLDGLELIRALILIHGTRAGASLSQKAGGAVAGALTQTNDIASYWRPVLAPLLKVGVATDADRARVIPTVDASDNDALEGQLSTRIVAYAKGLLSTAKGAIRPDVVRLRHPQLVATLLSWLIVLDPALPIAESMVDFSLDALEAAFAITPTEVIAQERAQLAAEQPTWPYWGISRWRRDLAGDGVAVCIRNTMTWFPHVWDDRHRARYWALLHWLDQPEPGLTRHLPPLSLTLAAQRAGEAQLADIMSHVAATDHAHGHRQHDDAAFSDLTARHPHPLLAEYPVLVEIVNALKERVLRMELARGEMPTPATPLALHIRHAGGIALCAQLLAMLAPTDLARGSAHGDNRATVFSHLLRATTPLAHEMEEKVARHLAAAKIDVKRLVAAAVYAPQWASVIEHYLDWPSFEDAVWWIHAHTKDSNWTVDQALRETWALEIAERTPLSSNDLLDGAVDVAWFVRSYAGLGTDRWEQVYDAAKYAASGTGHARARLFADAMTGRVTEAELRQRIDTKRTQDAVRALGLLPLPDQQGSNTSATASARYAAFQEFLRTGRTFGAQRRMSEATAARIGLENLARTAGYADPVRLQWAMEAEAAADLTDGVLMAESAGVAVVLSLDAGTGEPQIVVTRGERRLKEAPPAVKKAPAVAVLYARRHEIEHQVSRMRLSLEGTMCRGDLFRADEIAALLRHPVLARLLRNVVFVRASQTPIAATLLDQQSAAPGQGVVLGYPMRVPDREDVLAFRRFGTPDLTLIPIETADVRLAHPYDLYADGTWSAWQHDCFVSEQIQPFKQIFRELYLPTAHETRNGNDAISGRYAGHQVQPQKALALLGKRGWVGQDGTGVRRTFHAEGLSVDLSFDYGFTTAAEVEGLTIDNIVFTRRGEWKPIPLATVPPRIFSEAMRDLDLAVSVAHRGGVDPEATASTVEMRAVLVRETCDLLALANVDIKSAHVLIHGGLGDYSVHLGSAIVHRQPGGALCIVPIHSQHRGRLFLPFADADPRSAEVLSKVILLARDTTIKDPSILEQLM